MRVRALWAALLFVERWIRATPETRLKWRVVAEFFQRCLSLLQANVYRERLVACLNRQPTDESPIFCPLNVFRTATVICAIIVAAWCSDGGLAVAASFPWSTYNETEFRNVLIFREFIAVYNFSEKENFLTVVWTFDIEGCADRVTRKNLLWSKIVMATTGLHALHGGVGRGLPCTWIADFEALSERRRGDHISCAAVTHVDDVWINDPTWIAAQIRRELIHLQAPDHDEWPLSVAQILFSSAGLPPSFSHRLLGFSVSVPGSESGHDSRSGSDSGQKESDAFDTYLLSPMRLSIGAVLFFGGVAAFWIGIDRVSWITLPGWIIMCIGFGIAFQAAIMLIIAHTQ